jgi:hypothetical protein
MQFPMATVKKNALYIKSPVELCGSIFFLAELCRIVEAGKLDVK